MKDQPASKNYFLCFLLISTLAGSPVFTSCGEKPRAAQEDAEQQLKSLPATTSDTLTLAGVLYPLLTVEGLTWLASNLDAEVPDSWCYGNQAANCDEFGRLYRWQAAKEACAALGEGWRLPTDEEWRQLAEACGGYFDWLADQATGDPAAANSALLAGGATGFGAQLGGWRGSNGGYDSQGTLGFYWSTTEKDEDQAWFYIFQPERGKLTRRSTKKSMGMSCRCVRKGS